MMASSALAARHLVLPVFVVGIATVGMKILSFFFLISYI